MSGLGGPARHRVGVDHLLEPFLPLGTQVQVVLQQLPEHLPGMNLQLLFQLGVRQPLRLRVRQPRHHRLEALT